MNYSRPALTPALFCADYKLRAKYSTFHEENLSCQGLRKVGASGVETESLSLRYALRYRHSKSANQFLSSIVSRI